MRQFDQYALDTLTRSNIVATYELHMFLIEMCYNLQCARVFVESTAKIAG